MHCPTASGTSLRSSSKCTATTIKDLCTLPPLWPSSVASNLLCTDSRSVEAWMKVRDVKSSMSSGEVQIGQRVLDSARNSALSIAVSTNGAVFPGQVVSAHIHVYDHRRCVGDSRLRICPLKNCVLRVSPGGVSSRKGGMLGRTQKRTVSSEQSCLNDADASRMNFSGSTASSCARAGVSSQRLRKQSRSTTRLSFSFSSKRSSPWRCSQCSIMLSRLDSKAAPENL